VVFNLLTLKLSCDIKQMAVKLNHEQTKRLTFNQIAIESIRKLVLTILKNESKGLKDFFEANVPLEKGLRSTSQGNSTSRQMATS
jgi:hypothetical protein